MKEHYDKDAEERDKAQAKIVEQMLSPAIVFQLSETGDAIHDVFSGSIRSGKTYVVQQFGRYYALTIVRWLADVFSELTSEACHTRGIDAFFGVEEFFTTYRLDDNLLKRYKIWPLKMG